MSISCNAAPYTGEDSFVFVSYCHQDKGIVYPLIEHLASAGVRVWYDEGIVTGSDWAEHIAQKIHACKACLVILSRNAIASHNCKNELNYSFEIGKPIVPILYNQPALPNGIRFMLSSTQWLQLSEIPADEEIAKLIDSPAIRECKGIRDGRISVQPFQVSKGLPFMAPKFHLDISLHASRSASEVQTSDVPAIPDGPGTVEVPAPAPTAPKSDVQQTDTAESVEPASPSSSADYETPSAAEQPVQASPAIQPVTAEPPSAPTPIETPDQDLTDDNEKTIVGAYEDLFDQTIVMAPQVHPVIVVLSEGKRYITTADETVFGRSPACTVTLSNPEHTVSKKHAKLCTVGGKCYLVDLSSSNGTFVGSEKLESGSRMELAGDQIVQLANESIYIAVGHSAELLKQTNAMLILHCVESGEERFLFSEAGKLILGRNYAWNHGVFTERSVGREHATIHHERGNFYLQDHSQNGTYLNEQLIPHNVMRPLSSGDIMKIGNYQFTVKILSFGEVIYV